MTEDPSNNDVKKESRYTKRQWRLFSVVFAIGLAGILFNLLVRNDLYHSAGLYVGLPFLLALFLSLTSEAKSTIGITLKALTIAILLSAPVFMEGFICILFASPIMYGIAAFAAWSIDRINNKKKDDRNNLQLNEITVILALSIASLEGINEQFSFQRDNEIEYSRIVDSSVSSIRNALSQPSKFDKPRPLFIRIFPLPRSIEGGGLEIGDSRKLSFVYNKWIFFNSHSGDMTFQVAETKENYIRFDIPHDDSYLSHYLQWTNSEIYIYPIDEKTTKVTWKLSYIRKLDPIWYFGPLQEYAAWLTAKTLIDNVADPAI